MNRKTKMSHLLVKITKDDNGEEREIDLQLWHYITYETGTATFCEGEFFGEGESAVEYETKWFKRGGITCPKYLRLIKEIKAIKL